MPRWTPMTDAEGKAIPLTSDQQRLAEQYATLPLWCLKKWPRLARQLGDEAEGVARLADDGNPNHGEAS